MLAIAVVIGVALVCGLAAYALSSTAGSPFDLVDPEREVAALVRWLRRHQRSLVWFERRLDRTSATGMALTLALASLLVGAVVVGSLFEMVTSRTGLARWDDVVAQWGAGQATPTAVNILTLVTDLGSTPVVVGLAAVVALIELARRRGGQTVLFLVLVVGGQSLINNLLKWLVDRPRPEVARLVHVSGSSFPSGHSAAAAASWAAVALVLSRDTSPRARAYFAGGAAAVAGAVGTTRALLGAHWLTDVVAGLTVGWIWFTVVAVIFGGRRQRAAVPAERAAGVELPATPVERRSEDTSRDVDTR